MNRPAPYRLEVSRRGGRRKASTLARRARALPILLLATVPSVAWAQLSDQPGPPTGAPPPDAKALVTEAKAPGDVPKIKAPDEVTAFTLSSGGLLTSGNSRLLALTANGQFDYRRGANGFGASVLANYGQGAPPDQPVQLTTLNAQGRVRYDRYYAERASVFLITTGRHDRFQGLDFRLNIDPGLKYLFVNSDDSALWGEAGYDLQHDIRRDENRVQVDANKATVVDAAGNPVLVDKTFTDHSSRLFVGFRHSFNKEVNLSGGVEYLQSFVDVDRYRLNFDALFAAKIGGGLAVGFGLSARYDHKPLPTKKDLDTTTNVTLIYTFSESPPPPASPEAAERADEEKAEKTAPAPANAPPANAPPANAVPSAPAAPTAPSAPPANAPAGPPPTP